MFSVDDIVRLNPNTKTCTMFRTRRDAGLAIAVYKKIPIFAAEDQKDSLKNSEWGVSFRQGLFNMTSDSGLFRSYEQLLSNGYTLDGNWFIGKDKYSPVFEGKLTGLFDHRYGTFSEVSKSQIEKGNERSLSLKEKIDTKMLALPRYWINESDVLASFGTKIPKYWLSFHDISNPNNERTFISTIIPGIAVGNTLPVLIFTIQKTASELSCLCANFSSFIFDYIARQKICSRHFNFFVVKQLPVIPIAWYSHVCSWSIASVDEEISDWISTRVLELVYSSYDMKPFAKDLGNNGEPFIWNNERRFSIRCELDAAFFHLYGISRYDADYILDTFPIVKRRDEQEFGEYRTKRVILERYDEYAKAMKRNKSDEFTLVGQDSAIPAGEYPSVPALLTLTGLLEYLARLGVQVDNKRAMGGGVWVYRDKAEFGALAEHLQKSGVDVRYYPEGRKNRAGEQYEVDVGKRLG